MKNLSQRKQELFARFALCMSYETGFLTMKLIQTQSHFFYG
jgi:hypothetical protein